MYKIWKSIVFKYKKTNEGRKFLTERADIVATRTKFFRTLHNLSISGDERPVFYLDETWVNKNHSEKCIWQDLSRKGGFGGLRIPPGKRSRPILFHARPAETGFVLESKRIFRSRLQMRDSDYHSEMNADSFKEWFVSRFLNYLEKGCHNHGQFQQAMYHSTWSS
jgi:hypothetical protein